MLVTLSDNPPLGTPPESSHPPIWVHRTCPVSSPISSLLRPHRPHPTPLSFLISVRSSIHPSVRIRAIRSDHATTLGDCSGCKCRCYRCAAARQETQAHCPSVWAMPHQEDQGEFTEAERSSDDSQGLGEFSDISAMVSTPNARRASHSDTSARIR